MAVMYVSGFQLRKMFSSAECCECSGIPSEEYGKQWIVNSRISIYCPECFEKNGIELVDS